MAKVLKIIGAIVAVAGIAVAAYFAITKFICKKDECDDCDEICCFDEDDVVVEPEEVEEVAEDTEDKAE